ncbi:MAG: hypothetical protein AABZ65_03335 [Candidatus Omnitrophota bacterium]
MKDDSGAKTMRIGLNVPLFVASLCAMLIGAPLLGLIGVWGFLVQGKAVPAFLKVLHAHICWWSLVMVISSLIVPHLSLKPAIKKLITWVSFLLIPVYVILMTMHYTMEHPYKLILGALGSFYVSWPGVGVFVCESGFFAVMIGLGLLAAGVKIPFLTSDRPELSRYEISSSVEIPRKSFVGYSFFLSIAVITGFLILFLFTLQHKAVTPAALVQMHTHLGIFAVGLVMVPLAMSAVGAKKEKIRFASTLGNTVVFLTLAGLLIFIFFKTHSIIWIAPGLLYVFFLFLGWHSLWGGFGLREGLNHFTRVALIFIWGAMLFYALVGPLLGLLYDTHPNLTVTYKQGGAKAAGIYQSVPGDNQLHLGAYPDPEHYPGTAPVKGTPRGLENLHLSPTSWSHVAIFWLIILLIFGDGILKTIGRPTLIFLLAVTIAQAPFFNSIGRIGAWLDIKGGPGPLYLVGHPLKTLNIIMLMIVMILWLKKTKK